MERGNLVIYDLSGKVWLQTGYASGDVLPHEYPEGIPYMVIPYGEGGYVESVDVTQDPHVPIFITHEVEDNV